MRQRHAQVLALVVAVLMLASVTDLYSLDMARLPAGSDYLSVHTATSTLHPPVTGAACIGGPNAGKPCAHGSDCPFGACEAVRIGIAEYDRRGPANAGVDLGKYHFAGRLAADAFFTGDRPEVGGIPAIVMGGAGAHGTLVCDTAASDHPVWTGVAKGAHIYAGWRDDLCPTIAMLDKYQRLDDVYISNHSYREGMNNNGGHQFPLFLDWFARTRDAFITKSAGNEGPPRRSRTAQITLPGDAFNVVTVGAVDETFENRVAYSSYLLESDGSLPGPITVPNWRGKPEIVAPGGNDLAGDEIENDAAGNPRFLQDSGTSFAAPQVAAASALLVRLGLRLPGGGLRNHLAHKAIILNAARKRFISPPRAENAVARDNAATGTEPSDYDYLDALAALRVGGTQEGGTPVTRDWTPTFWAYDGTVFSTVRPLDDELGTGVLDVERTMIQFTAGEQGAGAVKPIGWNRQALAAGAADHVYAIEGLVTKGTFITTTLTWDRIVDELQYDGSPGNGIPECGGRRCLGGLNAEAECTVQSACPDGFCLGSDDFYQEHQGGLGFLPDFDVFIYRIAAAGPPVLVAQSIGIGNNRLGQNTEHLHVPVPETGRYEIHVRLNGNGGTADYGVAWWTNVADDFLCFETHRPPLDYAGVGLLDQFGLGTVTLKRAKRLCAPANTDGHDLAAPTDPQHLTAYTLKQTAPRFKRLRSITVTNRFGSLVVDVVKPDRLLVPTAKSLTATPMGLLNPTDHYKCYKVRGARLRRTDVPIETQFGRVLVDVKRPLHLCTPVDKNGEGLRDPVTHLMCYQAVTKRAPATFAVYTRNQFEDDAFPTFGVRELCVPSIKTLPPGFTLPTPVVTATPVATATGLTATATASPSPTPTPQIDLVIHKPKVISPGEIAVPDHVELTQGAQTFVNLDNDDEDARFDTGATDDDVAGENEMVQVELKLQPLTAGGNVTLSATAGGGDILVWTAANKGTPYVLGTALAVPGDFTAEGAWLVKRLWVEGIAAHTAQRATVLRMTYSGVAANNPDDVALTILGVNTLTWLGRQNGFTPGATTHDRDTLDGNFTMRRVFPDGRAPDYGLARDRVYLEVELSVAPIETVEVFTRAFDADDPSSDTAFIDPNDLGFGGNYSGTVPAIPYTAEEDNRGAVTGRKAGVLTGQDADGVVPVTFTTADTKKKTEFTVSHHPGDNYLVVANGDKAFLKRLRNLDKDDASAVTDPNVAGTAFQREIRQRDSYVSKRLDVWRLLHVEKDSMVAVPTTGTERNRADGNITAITGTATEARRVIFDVNLATGLPSGPDPSDNLSGTGRGRFENGTIVIGTTPATPALDGNGNDFAQKLAAGGIDIRFTIQGPPGPPPPPPDATGNIVGLAGTVFTLNVTGGALAAGHNGGAITVAGVDMTITAVDVPNHRVTVAALLNIPFVLTDDDSFTLPKDPPLVGLVAFEDAYVLGVDDGGGTGSNDQTVPFKQNGPNDSVAEVGMYDPNRGSKAAERDTFWVVYLCSGWQDTTKVVGESEGDHDPDSEEAFTGSTSPYDTVHNIDLAVGGDGAFVWREAELDSGQNADLNAAHEVGHQFGLGHGDAKTPGGEIPEHAAMGLMDLGVDNGGAFVPRHLNLIRSRVTSPGE